MIPFALLVVVAWEKLFDYLHVIPIPVPSGGRSAMQHSLYHGYHSVHTKRAEISYLRLFMYLLGRLSFSVILLHFVYFGGLFYFYCMFTVHSLVSVAILVIRIVFQIMCP